MNPHPTHPEAVADAAASGFKGDVVTAEVFPTTGPFKFQAWCDKCSDGYNGSRVPAEDWRDSHNRFKHQEKP